MELKDYEILTISDLVRNFTTKTPKIVVGDVCIIDYTPKIDQNFDKGCVYVFRKEMFTFKVLEVHPISQTFNMVNKEHSSIVNKFKLKYSTNNVIKCS